MSESAWNHEATYRRHFAEVNDFEPYPYQIRLAEQLTAGRNVSLRAPTGSGKTRAVLTPFVLDNLVWPRGRPARLIYALPLRSLVQQIHQEASELVARSGHADWAVTIQTGEQSDDEFFDRGRIVVTTYDQVLSGLLCAPYGLSDRQRNVNAAAVAGALVIFDEFHLMELKRAFLTGAAGLRLFRGLAQSVWMTATATTPPLDELHRALDCTTVSLAPEEMRTLPVVATTTRELRVEPGPLTADAVKQHATSRTVVIVNQVARAQALYRALESWADQQGIPLLCLHARFFKSDRDARVRDLRQLFGRGSRGPAISIATQVVEAGVDVSCDHLLTELCPMNALLQRAGRCARFENERGVVHVYGLPAEENAHLPYGSPGAPEPRLAATENLLRERESWEMSPELVEDWIERIHGESDASVLGENGWRERLNEVSSTIHSSLTLGRAGSVADLIRATDQSQIRAIVARAESLPESPARREAVSVSRWSLRELARNEGPASIWFWDLAGDPPSWKELRGDDALQRAFVVCLSPEVAAYSREVGLEIGRSGDQVSPPREPPPRPGHGTLRHETWVAHSRGVAREIAARWSREGANGLAVIGFGAIYDLSPEMLADALRACAHLHDIGKLQKRWQDWATNYQRDRDPSWTASEPLAHTDFDPDNPTDLARSRRVQPARGPHAVASAWYGMVYLPLLLASVPPSVRLAAISACAAAIVAHHGGWISTHGDWQDLDTLITGWQDWLAQLTGVRPPAASVEALAAQSDPRGVLGKLLETTMGPNGVERWFALVAYLIRTLRLSDRHATHEGGAE